MDPLVKPGPEADAATPTRCSNILATKGDGPSSSGGGDTNDSSSGINTCVSMLRATRGLTDERRK